MGVSGAELLASLLARHAPAHYPHPWQSDDSHFSRGLWLCLVQSHSFCSHAHRIPAPPRQVSFQSGATSVSSSYVEKSVPYLYISCCLEFYYWIPLHQKKKIVVIICMNTQGPDSILLLPSSLTQVIRRFAKQLDEWLRTALHGLPAKLIKIKFDRKYLLVTVYFISKEYQTAKWHSHVESRGSVWLRDKFVFV